MYVMAKNIHPGEVIHTTNGARTVLRTSRSGGTCEITISDAVGETTLKLRVDDLIERLSLSVRCGGSK